MASTDLVTPSYRPIYIGDVEANRPNSEAVNQKLAGNINYILTSLFFDEDFTVGGYFNNNAFDDGSAGIRYVANASTVSMYFMSLQTSGSGGTNSFNIDVYDNTGAFVNSLFGTGGNALQVSGSNGSRVVVGRNSVDTTPSNILVNTAGHTVQVGALNLATIPAGSILVPRILGNGENAINLHFKLRLKEL